MKRLPENVLLEIVRCPHDTLRGLAKRLCVSTHTIQRVRRLSISSGTPLDEIQAALYKPPMRIETVKPPIDFAAVIEQRAGGLSIKDCWKVYQKKFPSGFSLPGFSALVKKHAEVPDGFIPIGGPVAVPVNAHCERIHWPTPVNVDDDGENPLDGVLAVDEDGSSIKVQYGDLMISGARLEKARTDRSSEKTRGGDYRFLKATHGLRAVVVECDAMITTASLAWLEDQGIDLYIWTTKGVRVFAVSSPAAIRKAQYAADGLTLAKRLVVQKFVAGSTPNRIGDRKRQLFTDGQESNENCMEIRQEGLGLSLLEEVNTAKSVEAVRLVEARYSLRYWRSRSPVELKHYKSFPTAWRSWDGVRVSPISGTNSSATHPVNAMLNYAYAVLAARYEIAASVKGLDVSRACLHDGEHRKALVFDLIEFDRIAVANAVLAMIRGKTWKRADFRVDLRGSIRLQPGVAREVIAVSLPGRGHVRDVINCYCRWLQ